ncbi:hypothetical protein GX48_00650 [Paracoccidioides brasiliensis]|nr:hypothetical protein GX48_00650 [Paracoccidioides brasiliensis]
MVFRTFHFNSKIQDTAVYLQDEKAVPVVSSGTSEPSSIASTNPVIVPPPRRSQRPPPLTPLKPNSSRNSLQEVAERPSRSLARPEVPVSTRVSNLLEATAIPVPRAWTTRKLSRFLEDSNEEYLNSLLTDGRKSTESPNTPGVLVNRPLHVLLSLPNALEDDGVPSGPETPTSVGSLSLHSVPSLDTDYSISTPSSDPATPSFSDHRTPLIRKQRLFSPTEACPLDHPLLSPSICEEDVEIDETPSKLPTDDSNPSRPFPKLGATVKSNLTASLRALKSAAQSVSNFTAPSIRSEDFLTLSFFSFSPELTDDKHPVPMKNPPSPALRRYLNPFTASPANFHTYSEYPREIRDQPSRCTASIQMETYSSEVVKKACRCSRFSLTGEDDGATDDGDDQNFPQQLPVQRQREPRENGDFLRVVVLEMNMRRHGKLRSDIPGRAKIWLPPRKTVSTSDAAYMSVGCGSAGYKIPRRWVAVSADE